MAEGVRRIALTIAGSDSGGGAGIQADLKTFQAFGCFGTTAIVAVTAQNTLGVRGVHQVPLEMISAQLDALAVDLPPDALKTGMLATRDVVERVADEIGARGWGKEKLVPFGIFLAIGAAATWLWGPGLIEWYQRTFLM